MNAKIALVLASALGATVALPAISTASMAVERHESRASKFNADTVLRRLQEQGVDATSVEQWNGYIRAYVRLNGVETMQYFDADTLAPVTI